jgi:tagaturonate epimerase
MKTLEKYSMGIGDRFGRQGKAQLSALQQGWDNGMQVVPVWNKSHREHSIIHTAPGDVRTEADAAVKALAWDRPYHVDADHIGLSNVDLFIDASDFFTLDVADFTGEAAEIGRASCRERV